jgi:hypothetical protein
MDKKLELVNLKQNSDKQVHPTTKATVLGIEVDTVAMEVRLPPGRIQRIERLLAKDWESGANVTQVWELAGSLLDASKVCHQTRPFLSRINDTI